MRISLLLIILLTSTICQAGEVITETSYYTKASCLKEGTSGIMANGERLVDTDLVAASWDYDFGTKLRVTNISSGKSVIVTVKDRGPAKRLYRRGRKLDLSRRAFENISELRKGVTKVKVEVI